MNSESVSNTQAKKRVRRQLPDSSSSKASSSNESPSNTLVQSVIIPNPSSPNVCDTSTCSIQSTQPFETIMYICFQLDNEGELLVPSTTYLEQLSLLHFWLINTFSAIHKKEIDDNKTTNGLAKAEKEVPQFIKGQFLQYKAFLQGNETKVYETSKTCPQLTDNQFDLASLVKRKFDFKKSSDEMVKYTSLGVEMMERSKTIPFTKAPALQRLLKIDAKEFAKKYENASELQFTSSAICWITHLLEDCGANFQQDKKSGVEGNLNRKRLDFQVKEPFILAGEVKVEECLNGKDVNHSIEIALKMVDEFSEPEGYVLLIDRFKILLLKVVPRNEIHFLSDLEFTQESLCIVFLLLVSLLRGKITSIDDVV